MVVARKKVSPGMFCYTLRVLAQNEQSAAPGANESGVPFLDAPRAKTIICQPKHRWRV